MKRIQFLLVALLITTALHAQNKKISELPAAVSVTGTELVPIVQAGINKSATISQLSTGGTTAVANGGTGLTSYTIGDLIYASGTTTLAKLAGVATGNALISGGVSTAPSWGKIGLTTHVSGTLPIANGGTNATSFSSDRVPYFNGTSLTNGPYFTGSWFGVGGTPNFPLDIQASGGTTGRILETGNSYAGLTLQRTGTNPIAWTAYVPGGQTNLKLFDGTNEHFEFGTNGYFYINTQPDNDEGTGWLLGWDGASKAVVTYQRSSFQSSDAELTALASTTSAANMVPYFTGSGTASTMALVSGSYTPTISATSGNISSSTSSPAFYMRIGNIVHISGQLSITTSSSGNTTWEINLPIASNFTNQAKAHGTLSALDTSVSKGYGQVSSDATDDTLLFSLDNTAAATNLVKYTVTYIVE